MIIIRMEMKKDFKNFLDLRYFNHYNQTNAQ